MVKHKRLLLLVISALIAVMLCSCGSQSKNGIDDTTWYFYNTDGEKATLSFNTDANGEKHLDMRDETEYPYGGRQGFDITYSVNDNGTVDVNGRTFELGKVDGVRTLTNTENNWGIYYEDEEYAREHPQEKQLLK